MANRILTSAVLKVDLAGNHNSVSVARLFSGAAARYFGIPEDRIDDVKIAISEAFTSAIDTGEKQRISVSVMNGEHGVRFEVRTNLTKQLDENAIALAVITSLFEDADVKQDEHSSFITFSSPSK